MGPFCRYLMSEACTPTVCSLGPFLSPALWWNEVNSECNIILHEKRPVCRREKFTRIGAQMRVRNLLCGLAVVFFWLTLPIQPSAGAQGFTLKSGDTVVFYGDSITE